MAQEFDPYVQINPTQQVRDIYSAGPARALAQFPKPADGGVGEALSALVPALLDFQGKQDKKARERQDAEAAALVATEDANKLAKKLQEHIKKGTVPPGYSVYLMRQVNTHLGNKVFREFAIEADKRLELFSDPNYTEDAQAAVEEARAGVFEKLGIDPEYGSIEFQKAFGSAYASYETDFRRRAGKKRSDVKMEQGANALASEAVSLLDWSEDLELDSKILTNAYKPLINAYRKAGLPGAQAVVFNSIAAHVDTLLQSVDQEDISEAKEIIAALQGVDIVGDGTATSKTRWGHTHSTRLADLDFKAARATRYINDYSVQSAGKFIARLQGKSPWFYKIATRLKEEDTTPSELREIVAKYFKENKHPEEYIGAVMKELRLTAGRVGTAAGSKDEGKRLALQTNEDINNAATPGELARVKENYDKEAKSLGDGLSPEDRQKIDIRHQRRSHSLKERENSITNDTEAHRQVAQRAVGSKGSHSPLSPLLMTPRADEEEPTDAQMKAAAAFNNSIYSQVGQAVRAEARRRFDALVTRANAGEVIPPNEWQMILSNIGEDIRLSYFDNSKELEKDLQNILQEHKARREETEKKKADALKQESDILVKPSEDRAGAVYAFYNIAQVVKLREPWRRAAENGTYRDIKFDKESGTFRHRPEGFRAYVQQHFVGGWADTLSRYMSSYNNQDEVDKAVNAYHLAHAQAGFIAPRELKRVEGKDITRDELGITIPRQYLNPHRYPIYPAKVFSDSSTASDPYVFSLLNGLKNLDLTGDETHKERYAVKEAILNNYWGVTSKVDIDSDLLKTPELQEFMKKLPTVSLTTDAGKKLYQLPNATWRDNPELVWMSQLKLHEIYVGERDKQGVEK